MSEIDTVIGELFTEEIFLIDMWDCDVVKDDSLVVVGEECEKATLESSLKVIVGTWSLPRELGPERREGITS